jgi:photosystem II stability/assembly factor-like uncharacterized protein
VKALGRILLSLVLIAAVIPADAPAFAQDDDSPTAALSSMSWRSIGPANMGGRVTDIMGVPGDPRTFWFGGADGGLWKTTNGGTTFEGQWQDEESYSVGAVAMAPSDHNVLYLGSGEGDPRNSVSYGLGVWKSTDGGRSWAHLGLEGTERIKRVRVHPTDPDVAYVCAMGHEWGANEERGVYRTQDGGASWDKVLYIDEDTGCSDLDITWSNPRILYAGMWTFRRQPWHFRDGAGETALYKSTDGGTTWDKVNVVDEPMARIGVSVAQSKPSTLYVVTETPTKGTLFRSDDWGDSWRMVSDDKSINFRPFYYSDIRVDPSNPEVVWSLSGGLYKSTDGGRNFDSVGQGIHGDHQALWIDPEDSDRVLSGSDGGYQLSFDGGENWDIIRNVVLSQYYQIFVDDRDPYFVCGGLQDNGNWCGPSMATNGGFGGGGILMDDWYTVSGGDGFYTVPVPGKPNLVYSNAQGGYLRITDTDSGLTRSIEPYPRMIGSAGQGMFQAKYRFNWDAPIHISPHDPAVVYWGGNVLFMSGDYGQSWEIISPDLSNAEPEKLADSGGEIYNDNTAAEFHATILTVRESPLEAGVIWSGTDDGNVHVTRDGGANWTLINDNIPGLPAEAWVSKIDASHHVAGRAFINVDQHRLDDFTPHVWRCDDYGASCVDLSGGLPQDDYTKVIREDPTNGDLLYVGMERGIQASWDGGDTWHDLRLNLPRVSVRDIKIQPQYNDLVIGTHGRGAWILDDIAPLQQLADARGSDLHVFPARTATWWQQWGRDSSQGQRNFAGENPEAGAWINFYVDSAPKGPVKVRISDADGEQVQEFMHRGATAGVNRAVWSLRHQGPTPREQGQAGGGGFFARFLRNMGAPAVPGTYTATVIIGDREESTSFELRGDPRIDMTMAEYEEAHASSQRLIDLTSEANVLMDRVYGLTEQLTRLQDDVDSMELADVESVREQMGTALQELEDLNDKLQRPPDGMNYRDYPRFADETRSLMFGVMGTQSRPTEGQLTVINELEGDARRLRDELQGIVDGSIRQLNEMLGALPAITLPREGEAQ